jgi:DNA-binding SARP family transcriptional activator
LEVRSSAVLALLVLSADRVVSRERLIDSLCGEEPPETAVTCGRSAEVTGELQALSAEHPHRERLRRQLMLAFYRSGRQAEALAASGASGSCARSSICLVAAPV